MEDGLTQAVSSSSPPADEVTTCGRLMSDDAAVREPADVASWQRQVLEYVRQLGADHETTLTARANLGNQRGMDGDPIAALVDLEITTDRCQAVLGADHPTTVGAAGLRAYWVAISGDPAAALAAYDRLWPQAVRVLGPDHLTTVSIRHHYSDFRDWTDNPGGAVAAYEAILAGYTRVLGPDHPNTAAAAASLKRWRSHVDDLASIAADIYTDMELQESGRDVLSEEQRQRVEDDIRDFISEHQSEVDGVVELQTHVNELTRQRGPDDPEVLRIRRMLAEQKLLAGDTDGGLADYKAVITDYVRIFGPAHKETFEARRHEAFGLDHSAGGVRARAAALEALLADELSALGPADRLTMRTRMYLVGSQQNTAELDAVLADQIRILGPDHEDVALTRAWIGAAAPK